MRRTHGTTSGRRSTLGFGAARWVKSTILDGTEDLPVPDQKRQRQVVEAFCERMAQLERVPWEIIAWPDEETPGQGECDTHVRRGSAGWAIDHSRLESFENHGYDDRLFIDIVAPVTPAVASCHFPRA